MKTAINFYDMMTLLYLVIKESLSRCRLIDLILCKWQLLRYYFEWVWVILGGWDIILGGWGWVVVYGALFWVSGGGWGIILGWWGWVGKYFGWVGVVGDEWGWVGVGGGKWGWVHCLIMPVTKHLFMVQRNSHIFTMMYRQTCSPQINSLGVFTVVHKLLRVFNIVGVGQY